MMSKLLFIALMVLAMLGVAQATGGNFEVSSDRQTEGQRSIRRCEQAWQRGVVLSMRMLTCAMLFLCCCVLPSCRLAPLPLLPLRLAAIRRCLFRHSSHAAPAAAAAGRCTDFSLFAD
jgi:hypothetical protein